MVTTRMGLLIRNELIFNFLQFVSPLGGKFGEFSGLRWPVFELEKRHGAQNQTNL
jgi:hypothetical protein